MEKPVKVLVVDDDEDDFFLARGMLSQVERGTYQVEWAETYDIGLQKIDRSEHDVYLVDYRLGPESGLDLLRQAKAGGCIAPMILLTAQGDFEVDMQAMEAGADGYLNKNRLGSSELDRSIRYAITRNRLEREQRELELQMQEVQRLESLGLMAGGIAHDFNNLLAGILGYADLAKAELDPGAEVYKMVDGISRTAQEAAELTHQLLTYTGRSRAARQPLDLSRTIEAMSTLLGVVVSKKARLIYELQADLPPIEASAGQIRQLVMNLVTNATEALVDGSGDIIVRTGVIECDSKYLAGGVVVSEVGEGRYVYLHVIDTGCGVDAETKSRMFDPFFTTKFTGRGLGLASVMGIARSHDAVIRIESEAGRGTRFEVLFPSGSIVRPDVADCSSERQEAAPHQQGSGGINDVHPDKLPAPPAARRFDQASGVRAGGKTAPKSTILVVDDERVVREVVGMALRKLGYQVLIAADGQEAISLFRAHAERIAAVVLDATMPIVSGKEALAAIRGLSADVPVVLSSGFAEKEIMNDSVGLPNVWFMQKPYLPQDLAARIEAVIKNR